MCAHVYISRLFLWYGLDSRTVLTGWRAILHMMLSISLHHAWWPASLAKFLRLKLTCAYRILCMTTMLEACFFKAKPPKP